MKDPFEAAAEDQDSPPESPALPEEEDAAATTAPADAEDYDGGAPSHALPPPHRPSSSTAPPVPLSAYAARAKGREQEDDDDEEDHMEVDLEKLPSSTGDPDKLAKMNAILSQFTAEQMNRYESFRRSGFQKSNMRRTSILAYPNLLGIKHVVVVGIYIGKHHWKSKDIYPNDNCGVRNSKNVCW